MLTIVGPARCKKTGTRRYGGGGIFPHEPAAPTLKPLAQVLHARVLLHLTHDARPFLQLRRQHVASRVWTRAKMEEGGRVEGT